MMGQEAMEECYRALFETRIDLGRPFGYKALNRLGRRILSGIGQCLALADR